MKAIQLTEEDTTSSSRIFVKILFEELSSNFGIVKLRARLQSEEMKPFVGGLFPTDNPKNMRFAINYFTSIGLGALTEELREHLKVSQWNTTKGKEWRGQELSAMCCLEVNIS